MRVRGRMGISEGGKGMWRKVTSPPSYLIKGFIFDFEDDTLNNGLDNVVGVSVVFEKNEPKFQNTRDSAHSHMFKGSLAKANHRIMKILCSYFSECIILFVENRLSYAPIVSYLHFLLLLHVENVMKTISYQLSCRFRSVRPDRRDAIAIDF